MKRAFSWCVLVCCIVSVAAVGAAGRSESGTAAERPMEITWLNWGGQYIVDGNPVERMIEERFNVDIKVVKRDVSDQDAIRLMLAAGEMPDMMAPYGNPLEYWNQGLLRSIPFETVREQIPGFAKMFDDHPIAWLTTLVEGKTDEFMALPAVSEGIAGPSIIDFWRLDWLETLGIQPRGTLETVIPGRMWWTTEPFTFEEVERIFDGFANADPNQSGRKDTYAASGNRGGLIWPYINIASSFGLVFNRNIMEDGQLKMYYTSRAYRDFLKWLSQQYARGNIDGELAIQDFARMTEKLGAGMVGYWSYPYTTIGPIPEVATSRPQDLILRGEPDSRILVTPPVRGPGGRSIGYQYLELETLSNYWMFIGRQVSDEKLNKILQILQYTTFDPDMRLLLAFGEEGEHWQWTGRPHESPVQKLVALSEEEKGARGYGTVAHTGAQTYALLTSTYTKDWLTVVESPELDVVSRWIRDPNRGGLITGRSHRYDIFNETEYQALFNQHNAELQTQMLEFSYKAIIGEIDVDSGWDAYVARLMRSGLAEMLEELAKAPLTDELHQGRVVR